MNLRDLLDAAAARLPGVEAANGPAGVITWSRGGRPFAVIIDDGAAEFRLDRAVAAAAARTPDVELSDRAQDWVRFRPGVLDDHAADRATAWFASAYRHLGE